MAETKEMTIEGVVTLAYFTGERDSKHVLIRDENAPTNGPGTEPASQRRLESFVCDMLGFPSEAEFDEMFKRLDQLRQKQLRPAEGTPDGVRENVKLRVTIEVLD